MDDVADRRGSRADGDGRDVARTAGRLSRRRHDGADRRPGVRSAGQTGDRPDGGRFLDSRRRRSATDRALLDADVHSRRTGRTPDPRDRRVRAVRRQCSCHATHSAADIACLSDRARPRPAPGAEPGDRRRAAFCAQSVVAAGQGRDPRLQSRHRVSRPTTPRSCPPRALQKSPRRHRGQAGAALQRPRRPLSTAGHSGLPPGQS